MGTILNKRELSALMRNKSIMDIQFSNSGSAHPSKFADGIMAYSLSNLGHNNRFLIFHRMNLI